VTNTGERIGDEVAQFYTRHPGATVPRPIKELKGFKRTHLGPGECKTMTFTLHTHQLGYYDEGVRYAVDPGTVELWVGFLSQNLPLAGQRKVDRSFSAP